MNSSTDKPSPKRLAGMDVLRGLAVALVMLRHAWPRFFGEAGAVGVAIFFTLSGYLITGVLLRDSAAPPRQFIWRFCRNRALRLLPALLILLLIFGVVEKLTNRLADKGMVRSSLILGLTYTSDLPLLHIRMSPGISHLWTLAVEEQFYLLWPFIFIIARKRLKKALALMAAAAMLLGTMTVVAFPGRGEAVYMFPTTWAVTLVIGAAAFVWRHARQSGDPLNRKTPWNSASTLPLFRYGSLTAPTLELLSQAALQTGSSEAAANRIGSQSHRVALPIAAVAALLLLCVLPDGKHHPACFLVLGPIVSALTVSLIRTAEDLPGPLPFAVAPLRYLGIISYGAYLWNFPIVSWLRGPVLRNAPPWCGAASIILTIIAAVLSWHLAEKHVARFKRGLDRGPDDPTPMPLLKLRPAEELTMTADAA